jgi:hypothetical protein
MTMNARGSKRLERTRFHSFEQVLEPAIVRECIAGLGSIVDAAVGDTVCGLSLWHLGAVDNLGDTLFTATLAQSNACGGSVTQNVSSEWPEKGWGKDARVSHGI